MQESGAQHANGFPGEVQESSVEVQCRPVEVYTKHCTLLQHSLHADLLLNSSFTDTVK